MWLMDLRFLPTLWVQQAVPEGTAQSPSGLMQRVGGFVHDGHPPPPPPPPTAVQDGAGPPVLLRAPAAPTDHCSFAVSPGHFVTEVNELFWGKKFKSQFN